MSRSYRPPISVQNVLADAAATMGLKLPPEAEQSVELQQALATGISLHGPTRDVLTKLLAPYGYGWSVQNGRLQVLKSDQHLANEAVLIDQSTGMIETPSLSLPHRAGDVSELSFDVLLKPELSVGGLVEMGSQSVTGFFRLKEVVHSGDTHGADWKSSCKAVPIGSPLTKKKGRR